MDSKQPEQVHTPITAEQFEQVLEIISTSTTGVDKASQTIGISPVSFRNYMKIVGEQAETSYAHAKAMQYEKLFDEMQDLENEMITAVQECDPKCSSALATAYRTKIDNLKWALSKLVPKKYGEHLTIKDDRALPNRLQVELIQPKDNTSDKSLNNNNNELNNV